MLCMLSNSGYLFMSNKLNLDFLNDLAKVHEGKCISKEYINSITEYTWQCKNLHIWESKYISIKKGAWCKICLNLNKYDELVNIAKSKNGKLITKEFLGSVVKHTWECSEGHRWDATATKIKNDGSWCPECLKIGLPEMHKLASEKNGECLSNKYVNNTTNLEWRCEKNHIFQASPSSVQTGSWCPTCRKIPFERLQQKAIEKGGELLSISTDYNNQFDKLIWKCSYDHIFKMSSHDVMSRNNHWCPKCKESFGEKFSRIYFEKYFKKQFNKIRPDWLIGINGKKLELDGYNEELKIAFEHQGDQHYDTNHPLNQMNQNPNTTIENDKIKNKLCKENKIQLIYIPQLRHRVGITGNKNLLRQILVDHGFTENINIEITQKELNTSRLEKIYNTIKLLVESKEGKLLDNIYISDSSPIQIICKQNHKFITTAGRLKSDRWCPECAPNKKLNYKKVKQRLSDKNIKLISNNYVNSTTELKLQCKICSYEWNSDYNNISSGRGCPKCGRKKSNDAKRISIEDVIAFAKQNELILRNPDDYSGAHDKSTWICKNNHEFIRPLTKLKNNTKCPECKKLKNT